MGSPPISRIQFLDSGGSSLETPLEWQTCLIVISEETERWDHVSLERNHEPLPTRIERVAGQPRIVATWPFSGAGRFRLSLRLGHDAYNEEIIIEVSPQKISRNELHELVEDLDRRLPATIAISLQRAGALAGIHLQPPQTATLAAERLRLRRAVLGTDTRPGLGALLPAIALDPHQMLLNNELWVYRHQVRRPSAAALVKVVSRAGNVEVDRRPRTAVDVRVEHNVDVYENRLLKAYTYEVDIRLRHFLSSAVAAGNVPLADEARLCIEQLTAARRAARFLDDVLMPAHQATRPTVVFLRRPDYRAMFEGYLEFHRTAHVQLDEPTLAVPLENLPRLYEVWGTLQVLDALARVAFNFGYRVRSERLYVQKSGELFLRLLPDGRPALVMSHPQFGTIEFIPQFTYSAYGRLRSISYNQRPDVSIHITRFGQDPRVLIFDPKYKLDSENLEPEANDGKPKKADIDAMHAYRDAIRNSRGRRLVEYAAILYPGQSVEYGAGLAALRARPMATSGLSSELRTILSSQLAAVIDTSPA